MISMRGSGGRHHHDSNDDERMTVTSDKILIATSTRPRIPRISGLKESGYITSDEALRFKNQPKVLTIIGFQIQICLMFKKLV
jgi:pyruvate/2-oxoglutarate dehydrogenase complex dihydrolipoamide dehydrogenase (E3) component